LPLLKYLFQHLLINDQSPLMGILEWAYSDIESDEVRVKTSLEGKAVVRSSKGIVRFSLPADENIRM